MSTSGSSSLDRLLLVNHAITFRSTFLLLAGLLPLGKLALAQSPAVRASLESFRDTLETIVARDQFRLIERRVREAERNSHDAILALRHGFTLLRKAETEDGRLFDRARDAFRLAGRLQPEWAYPDYGIGLAESGKGAWLAAEPANLGTRVGHGALRSAVRALVEAAQKDPQLTPALVELDAIATALRDTVITRQVLETHRRAVAAGNQHPAVLLALGRIERFAGTADASIAALERYADSEENPSLARLEIARTLLTAGNPAGDSLYFAAALSLDSATAAELRADLNPIAEAGELDDFDLARGEARQALLRSFWVDRARRDLRQEGERLREHYRRLQFARLNFALGNNRRYYGFRDLYRAPLNDMDDRGVAYIRHGKPDERLTPMIFGLTPNETWLYRQADGDVLIHFSAGGEGAEGGDLGDYRLVASVLDLRGNDVPLDLRLLSRSSVSDLYERMLGWGPHGSARASAEERALGEESAAIATGTDAFELRFAEPLEVKTDLVVIGRVGSDRALLHIVYALETIGDPVRLRVAFFDSAGVAHAWQDSTATPDSTGLGGAVGRFEVPVPPGTWTYRLAFQRGEAGTVLPLDTMTVPGLASTPLVISDIGLGEMSNSVQWAAGPADTALLSPRSDFPRDGELQVYYETYGLVPGEQYQTSVAVYERHNQRLGRNRLRLGFTEQSPGEVTRSRRGIRLAGLEPGEYWLEVIVEHSKGRQVSALKRFRVISVAQ